LVLLGLIAITVPALAEPFEGRERVPVADLFGELRVVAHELEQAATVRRDFEELAGAHRLARTEAIFRDYVRVRLAFEATRDGGLWDLRWTVTNREPRSDEIWAQWHAASVPGGDAPTASAECDELSALFAVVARALGVRRVGLLWPASNHTVAVWTVPGADGKPVRVVVPTSQVFLTPDASLGTKEFDPWKQRTVYDYQRRDVGPKADVPGVLARYFVRQARLLAALPQEELQRRRNARSKLLGGS
jgi:hypothetical protein